MEVCAPEVHDRLRRDSDAWALLPIVGTMKTYDEADTVLDLRNCKCGSTIAREVKR